MEEGGADCLADVGVVDVAAVGEVVDRDGGVVVHVVLGGPLLVLFEDKVVAVDVAWLLERRIIAVFYMVS